VLTEILGPRKDAYFGAGQVRWVRRVLRDQADPVTGSEQFGGQREVEGAYPAAGDGVEVSVDEGNVHLCLPGGVVQREAGLGPGLGQLGQAVIA
jgi:hypothetical protein